MKYRKPNSGFPRQIWEEACLSDESDADTIRILVDTWISMNAYMYCDSDNIFYVTWMEPSKSSQKITAKYETFHRWILCACTPVVTPQPQSQQNLSLEQSAV